MVWDTLRSELFKPLVKHGLKKLLDLLKDLESAGPEVLKGVLATFLQEVLVLEPVGDKGKNKDSLDKDLMEELQEQAVAKAQAKLEAVTIEQLQQIFQKTLRPVKKMEDLFVVILKTVLLHMEEELRERMKLKERFPNLDLESIIMPLTSSEIMKLFYQPDWDTVVESLKGLMSKNTELVLTVAVTKAMEESSLVLPKEVRPYLDAKCIIASARVLRSQQSFTPEALMEKLTELVQDPWAMVLQLLINLTEEQASLLEPVWMATVKWLTSILDGQMGIVEALQKLAEKNFFCRVPALLKELKLAVVTDAAPLLESWEELVLLMLKAALLSLEDVFEERLGRKGRVCVHCMLQQATAADLRKVCADFYQEPEATLELFKSHLDIDAAIMLATATWPELGKLENEGYDVPGIATLGLLHLGILSHCVC